MRSFIHAFFTPLESSLHRRAPSARMFQSGRQQQNTTTAHASTGGSEAVHLQLGLPQGVLSSVHFWVARLVG